MCGIAALVTHCAVPPLPPWPFWKGAFGDGSGPRASKPVDVDLLRKALAPRGPDAQGALDVSGAGGCVAMLGSVLNMRSQDSVVQQPLRGRAGDVLLFNGEVYGVGNEDVAEGVNDTRMLLGLLEACEGGAEEILERVLQGLRGPWTLLFWRESEKRLYFARDALGRRSLLMRLDAEAGAMCFTSVAPPECLYGFYEVPPSGLCFLDMSCQEMTFGIHQRSCISVLPARSQFLNRTQLKEDTAPMCVAGSGTEMYVSFLPQAWLRSIEPGDSRIKGAETEEEAESGGVQVSDLTLADSASLFLASFGRSIQRRMAFSGKHVVNSRASVAPRFAVLFSGGIDSLFIAAMLHLCMPDGETLDLINVAFGANSMAIDECPDRRNAIAGLKELVRLSDAKAQPQRDFRLICVDVSPEEADLALEDHVRHLLHPCDQPMDASIGTALWMAARGRGRLHVQSLTTKHGYESSAADAGSLVSTRARIMFSGLGADELMGGYKGRHRTIFRAEGESGIRREMDADLSRLWFRNLGRDDRLIADHGREVRQPFLDEDLVALVTSLPLKRHVCDLSLPDGVGDKHLLRRAASSLGLSNSATTCPKRAIQFGSRSKQVIERKRKQEH